MNSKYELSVISMSTGKTYKSFDIDGDKTIGVNKSDKFKIRVKNNTYSKVQIRLSVDGTDVLSGKPASTSTHGKMFVLSPRGQDNSILELEAWPEDENGGAAFVFGDSEKGVAINTHKETAGIGRIAVAVFEESSWGRRTKDHLFNSPDYSRRMTARSSSLNDRINNRARKNETKGVDFSYSANLDCDVMKCCAPASDAKDVVGVASPASSAGAASAASFDFMEESVSVGAGEYTDQKITKTAGLRSPKFTETVEVKYETWGTLKSKLSQFEEPEPKLETAFPGDSVEQYNDLSSVPRQ